VKTTRLSLREKLLKNSIASESGCRLWVKPVDDQGYGHIGINGKIDRAHRASYREFVGEIPTGMFVCHRCDVRHCINPEHLFLGSNQENIADMVSKGRNALGERNHKAKLTEADVKMVRHLYSAERKTYRAIGELYGVTEQAVYAIIRGKNWKHVDHGRV
jgi:hypothetical protein